MFLNPEVRSETSLDEVIRLSFQLFLHVRRWTIGTGHSKLLRLRLDLFGVSGDVGVVLAELGRRALELIALVRRELENSL